VTRLAKAGARVEPRPAPVTGGQQPPDLARVFGSFFPAPAGARAAQQEEESMLGAAHQALADYQAARRADNAGWSQPRTHYAPGGGPTILMPYCAAVLERGWTAGSLLSGSCVRSGTLSPAWR
jgi:hypothetical protein